MEKWYAYKHTMMQVELNVDALLKNSLGWQDCVCSALNHTRLVSQGDKPNKKTLMYIPCVSRDHRVYVHNHIILGWVKCIPKSNMHTFTKARFRQHLGNCNFSGALFFSRLLLHKTSTWGENPNKESLMYIPCVSCNHRLSDYLQIEKKAWSGGITYRQIGCVNFE